MHPLFKPITILMKIRKKQPPRKGAKPKNPIRRSAKPFSRTKQESEVNVRAQHMREVVEESDKFIKSTIRDWTAMLKRDKTYRKMEAYVHYPARYVNDKIRILKAEYEWLEVNVVEARGAKPYIECLYLSVKEM